MITSAKDATKCFLSKHGELRRDSITKSILCYCWFISWAITNYIGITIEASPNNTSMNSNTTNPYAATVGKEQVSRNKKTIHWIRNACITAANPIPYLLVMRGTWLLAWCELGHMPRAMLDDPKFISPLVTSVHRFADSTFPLWFFGGLLTTLLSVIFLRSRLLNLAVGIISWLGTLCLTGGMLEWFLD